MSEHVFECLAVCGGIGGQTLGFLEEEVRLFGDVARFKCRGSIDNDPIACLDYERLTGSPAWCVDIMAIDAFWSTPMFRAAFGQKAPHLVAISAPCKGASRLLAAAKAKSAKYRQLNRLAVVWCEAMLDAWGDDPPALIVLENVPGLPTRAKAALRSLRSLLRSHGYVFHASTHDCGEIGGLAQHRERYLLVARHPEKCPPLLYQPPKKRVRGIGEVIGPLPMPATVGAAEWGELHTMPRLSWCNWLRLAHIPAGGDWRDLAGVLQERARREVFRRHAVASWDAPAPAVTGPGGHSVEAINDPRIAMAERIAGAPAGKFGSIERVLGMDETAPTVTSGRAPSSGRPAIADERIAQLGLGHTPPRSGAYGVEKYDAPSHAVVGASKIDNRPVSVADERIGIPSERGWFNGALGVQSMEKPAATITSGDRPRRGRFAVADDRVQSSLDFGESTSRHWAKHDVRKWTDPALTVIGKEGPSNGGASVADERVRDPHGLIPAKPGYDAAYGVLGWDDPARTVAGAVAAGTGAYAVADPRALGFVEGVRMLTLDEAMTLDLDPKKPPPFIPVIVAEDGTWHRPLTLLELAVIQSIPARMKDGSPLRLSGTRTEIALHVGNLIPPESAKAIGRVALVALLQAAIGAFALSAGAVWVERDRQPEASQ